MRSFVSRLRARRRARTVPFEGEDRVQRALDRSQLLAELEVSVPAPERIVHWDAAKRVPASHR